MIEELFAGECLHLILKGPKLKLRLEVLKTHTLEVKDAARISLCIGGGLWWTGEYRKFLGLTEITTVS